MYSSQPLTRGEAELERLLEQVDEVIEADGSVDTVDIYWEAWETLPSYVRDLLLITAPDWWALPARVFRRLLLTAAYLIVRDGVAPLAALQRTARQLRLPPPRQTGTHPHGGFRRTMIWPQVVHTVPVRRFPIAARWWVRSPVRRFGRVRQLSFRR